MTKTHTATPWQWYDGCSWRRLGTIKGQGSPDSLVVCPTIDSDGHPNLIVNQFDMEFIVRAVNSHEELVETLQAMYDYSIDSSTAKYTARESIELAKQALKKAGE